MPKTVYTPTETNSIDISEHANLVDRYRHLKTMIRDFENEAAEIATAIKATAGTRELITVAGRPVLRQNPSGVVAWSKLATANRETVIPYLHEVTVEELDKNLFKAAHPEIVEEFTTRRLEIL